MPLPLHHPNACQRARVRKQRAATTRLSLSKGSVHSKPSFPTTGLRVTRAIAPGRGPIPSRAITSAADVGVVRTTPGVPSSPIEASSQIGTSQSADRSLSGVVIVAGALAGAPRLPCLPRTRLPPPCATLARLTALVLPCSECTARLRRLAPRSHSSAGAFSNPSRKEATTAGIGRRYLGESRRSPGGTSWR